MSSIGWNGIRGTTSGTNAMEPTGPSLDVTAETALRRWPQLSASFVRHRLGCLGCPMARFCTLGDVAAAYDLPASAWLAELTRAVEATPTTGAEADHRTLIDPHT